MIWFTCKQCGKRHGREEQLAGTLVFCECGQGNRVPWSSTVAEPEPEEALPAPSPAPPSPPLPPVERGEREGRPRRFRNKHQLNPDYCLNHEETPKQAICAACRCSFCSACVVTLQGQTLCGPCKNFRLGSLSRPARVSPLAVVAFVFGLVSIVVSLFLTFMAVGFAMLPEFGMALAIICCLMALLFAGGESVVSWLALRQMDRQAALGGRSLAMTGAAAGLTGVVWAFSIALFVIARQVQG